MKTKASGNAGYTLIELAIVVSVVGLLATISIPNLVRAHSLSQRNSCINNLRQIQSAMIQWALETKQPAGAPVRFDDIRGYLRQPTVCPAGGTSFFDSYTITNLSTRPVCQKVPTGPGAHALAPES